MEKKIFILITFMILSFVSCGRKADEETDDSRSPVQAEFEKIEKFERENPEDIETIEKKYRKFHENNSFSQWGDKAKSKADELYENRARNAFDQAGEYRKKNPDNIKGIIKKYSVVARRFKDSLYAEKAEAVIQELSGASGAGAPKLIQEWGITWTKSKRSDHPLDITLTCAEDDMPEGAELWWRIAEKEFKGPNTIDHQFDTPRVHVVECKIKKGDKVLKYFATEVKVGLRYCRDIVNEEIIKINDLIVSGKSDRAYELADKIVSWNISVISSEAEIFRAGIKADLTTIRDFYKTIFGFYNVKGEYFDRKKAASFVKKFGVKIKSDVLKDIVMAETQKLKKANLVYKEALNGFKDRIGQIYRIGGISGKIMAVGNNLIVFQAGGNLQYEKPIYEVRKSELFPIIKPAAEDIGFYNCGAFMEYLCNFTEAYEYYERSRRERKGKALKLLSLKENLYREYSEGVTGERVSMAQERNRMMDAEAKGEELFGLHMKLIRKDFGYLGITDEYYKLIRIPQVYHDVRHAYERVHHIEVPKGTGTWKKMEKILAKWEKDKKRVQDEAKKVRKTGNELNKKIKDVHKTFDEWEREGFEKYISLLEKELVKVRKRTRDNKYLKKKEKFGKTQYEQLDEALRNYVFKRNEYRNLYRYGLKPFSLFLFKRLKEDRKIYSKPMLELIHRKIFLEVAFEKATLEFNVYFRGI